MASRVNLRHALMQRYGRGGSALYSLIGILLAAGIAGIAALVFRQPLLFPSVGPSAYLAFETPTDSAATPRNALIGHGLALLVALGALQIFGMANHPSALAEGMTLNRLLAAVLALAVTSAILVLLDAMHPPAGATSLIVTLGLLKGLQGALVIAIGVLIVVLASALINRALGVRMPLRPLKD
jgi:CBS-domain-containing membrane protein